MSRVNEERAPRPGSNKHRVVTPERIEEIYWEVAESYDKEQVPGKEGLSVEEIYREVMKPNEKGRVSGKGCLSQLYSTCVYCHGQSSRTPFPTQQEARIRELEDMLKAQHEEKEARMNAQIEEMEARIKARKEEMEAREERARDEDQRIREFRMMVQDMTRMIESISQSTGFDRLTSLHPPPPPTPPPS